MRCILNIYNNYNKPKIDLSDLIMIPIFDISYKLTYCSNESYLVTIILAPILMLYK